MIRLHFSKSSQSQHSRLKRVLQLIIFCGLAAATFSYHAYAQAPRKIKVVLDAGHGGKDTGAIGYGINEKDVALQVTLLVAELLEKRNDIAAIYTRKRDVFIGLRERANIANDASADLFISIHCNSVANSSPYGAETFVLGLHRNEDNLKIAMRENQVIELEENYQEKYDGFDPTSPESYIGFSLLQEQYLDQSILLADIIQKNFVGELKRKNRGVKQAGFLVLRETYMPSVLVELGFLSNKNENSFLKSSFNQKKLAQQIFNAILQYKESLEKNSSSVAFIEETIEKNDVLDDSYEATFYVQFAAGKKKLKLEPYNFNGLENVTRVKESGLFKYRYGKSNSHKEIQNHLLTVKEKGYKGAFIVAYLNGKKISIEDALKTQIK